MGPLRGCGLRSFNFSVVVSVGPTVWPDLHGLYERLHVAEELGTQVSRDLNRILERLKNMSGAANVTSLTNITFSPTGNFLIIFIEVAINVVCHRRFSLISWTCKTCLPTQQVIYCRLHHPTHLLPAARCHRTILLICDMCVFYGFQRVNVACMVPKLSA